MQETMEVEEENPPHDNDFDSVEVILINANVYFIKQLSPS